MVERFYRQAEEPFVLHVGHPFHLKGCDLLIAAFNSIHARFPAWRLVVIGHGLEEHIKVRPSWLEVLPGISHSAVADWMSRCSVFVLASRSEAMGRALVEAAAAGKPRIAARVDGTYTTIRHGIDGLLVPANDAEALATALSELLADRELRVRLGDAGHRRAFSDFGAERYVQELTSLTDSALLRFSR
jgi:glycosyltransferase involved in cell wall biosynthesis